MISAGANKVMLKPLDVDFFFREIQNELDIVFSFPSPIIKE